MSLFLLHVCVLSFQGHRLRIFKFLSLEEGISTGASRNFGVWMLPTVFLLDFKV